MFPYFHYLPGVVAVGCIKETERQLIVTYMKHMYISLQKLIGVVKNVHCTFTRTSCNMMTTNHHYDENHFNKEMDEMALLVGPSTEGIKVNYQNFGKVFRNFERSGIFRICL